MSDSDTSPPKIVRLSRASPSDRPSDTDPTPVIAATPSAMQARKMRKPEKPPFRSRSARRNISGMAIPSRARRFHRAGSNASAASTIAPERNRDFRDHRASPVRGHGSPEPELRPVRASAAKMRSTILAPVVSSRLPVGSSATRIARVRCDGARQRHALLFAARQLRRIMAERGRPGRPAESSCAARPKGSGAPESSSGTATFSSAVMVGIRWKDWNTMPIRAPRNWASWSSSSGPNLLSVDPDRARFGRSSPAMAHQQRRFAGA